MSANAFLFNLKIGWALHLATTHPPLPSTLAPQTRAELLLFRHISNHLDSAGWSSVRFDIHLVCRCPVCLFCKLAVCVFLVIQKTICSKVPFAFLLLKD